MEEKVSKKQKFKITYYDNNKACRVWYMNIGWDDEQQAHDEVRRLKEREDKLMSLHKSRSEFKVEPIKTIKEL